MGNWLIHTTHGSGDPARLKSLSPDAQLAALSSHVTAPKTTAQAMALINQHAAAGSLIALHGCANPCPREGCKGFATVRRGCAGYLRGKK